MKLRTKRLTLGVVALLAAAAVLTFAAAATAHDHPPPPPTDAPPQPQDQPRPEQRALPQLVIENAEATAEANDGFREMIFRVPARPSRDQLVTVDYSTTDGSAVAPIDYLSTGSILAFAPGVIEQTIAVHVRGDNVVEADETVLVRLSKPANATIGAGEASGVIVNDDKPCRCDRVTGKITGVSFAAREPNGPSIIAFAIDWGLWCPGPGKGCAGEVQIVPPKGSDLRPIWSSTAAISCKGPCDALTSGKGNISFRSENTLDNRASRGYVFRLLEICVNDGNKEVVGAREIKVFFGPRGLLDRRRSDLNGDGQPDGA